ncbi:MAG: hypothetical protein WDW38_001160 [Sanguina aurantia]
MRRAKLDAVIEEEEQQRMHALAKVQNHHERTERVQMDRHHHNEETAQRALDAGARRDAAYQGSVLLAEQRRADVQHKNDTDAAMAKQREQVRILNQQIQAEEDFLKEQQRQATKERADADAAAKVSFYSTRNAEKEASLRRRQIELDAIRDLKAEEARARADHIELKARLAAEDNEVQRKELERKLQGKMARADALASTRGSLVEEMRVLRNMMQRQEELVRTSLVKLKQSGRRELPPNALNSLQRAQLTSAANRSQAVPSPDTTPRLLLSAAAAAAAADPRVHPSPRPSRPASASARPDTRNSQGKSVDPASRYGRDLVGGAGGATASGGGGGVGNSIHSSGAWGGPSPQQHRTRTRPMSASVESLTGSPARRGSLVTNSSAARKDSAGGGKPFLSAVRGSTHSKAATAGVGRGQQQQRGAAAGVGASSELLKMKGGLDGSARYSTFNVTPKPNEGYGQFGGSGRREDMLRTLLQEEIQKESDRQTLLAKVTDERERARLSVLFSSEREEAKARILALSSAAPAPTR